MKLKNWEFLKTQQKKKHSDLEILEMLSLKKTSQVQQIIIECGWIQNNDPPKSASYLLIELRDKH